MQYNWDINELESNKKRLITLLNDDTDTDLIMAKIRMYDMMISKIKKDVLPMPNKSLYSIDDIITDQKIFNENEECFIISSILDKAFETFKDIHLAKPNIKMPSIDNIALTEYTKDFFNQMTNIKIYNKALEILKPDNHILSMEKQNKFNSIANFYTYDDFNKKGYIGVGYTNTYYDLKYLVHEMFHYIFNHSNQDVKSILLSEVEGIFSNILVNYYFEKNKLLNPLELYSMKSEDVITSRIALYTIKYQNITLKNIDQNNNINLKEVNNDTKKFGACFDNVTELLNAIAFPKILLTQYPLAFLIAVDLFYIYLEDSNYALGLLECIKKDSSDILDVLKNNHITFFNDEYSNLKKYIKSIKID